MPALAVGEFRDILRLDYPIGPVLSPALLSPGLLRLQALEFLLLVFRISGKVEDAQSAGRGMLSASAGSGRAKIGPD
jgi:hypothetical protein